MILRSRIRRRKAILGVIILTTLALVPFVYILQGDIYFMDILNFRDLDALPYGIGSCDALKSGKRIHPVHDDRKSIFCHDREQTFFSELYTRDLKGWRRASFMCNRCFNFVQGQLKTPAGETPISIYRNASDIWVSTGVLSTGGFEPQKFTPLFKMLQNDPSLAVIDIGANIGKYH